MKIIFLDFDGPLTNRRAWIVYDKPASRMQWTTADPVGIGMLNGLCRNQNAKIVISSTWHKIKPPNLPYDAKDARDCLRQWGFEGDIHEHWRTIDHGIRTYEILSWLDLHKEEVEYFCSIDDDHLKKIVNPVIVHPEDGIGAQDYYKAKSFLSGDGVSLKKALEKFSPDQKFAFSDFGGAEGESIYGEA